ncbi:MAG: Nramp family divalent metal transporter [Ignavibacteriales bacterium]|nr:Nramp family divalent metal transporter [Ignavibacteriales bacterium]
MNNKNQKSESLSEVHRSVSIPKNAGTLKRFLAFIGPAYLVSVGYMDPGNWATDLEGGARFGYSLIWVLLMSNLIAVLLQTLSARLGIVTGRDLAQACRENYPKPVAFILWVLCEIAIAACDLAEVLGTAIGLNLLLNVPLLYGVIITGFDTILFLVIQNFGIRKVEAFIVMLISTIGLCFGIEIFLAEPVWGEVAKGFVPHLTSESLYVAIGILGATVMPHNLYLHSALVQTRAVCETDECKKQACRWNLLDTSIALNAAFFVNAAILIVAASVFYKNGIVVTEIQQAHHLLTPLLGTTIASTLFALALLSAGQSSTLTGTLAGQIVMEGFLQFKMRPVIRRLITRILAIVPAVIVLTVKGDEGSYGLLILSQVILSLQLPFAVVPLIHFTSDKVKMKQFANKKWVLILAWTAAVVIIALNARLVYGVLSGWIETAGSNAIWIWITVIPIIIGCAGLLLYITFPKLWRKRREVAMPIPSLSLSHQTYNKIGVALDFGGMEETVLSHAQSIAQHHNAAIYLFHVVEGVSGQLFGKEAFDDEARSDKEHIENISEQLRTFGFEVHTHLGFGNVPKQLVKLANETQIDLLIMGGHRHSGLKDLIFGTTVPKVRHELKIPVLVV